MERIELHGVSYDFTLVGSQFMQSGTSRDTMGDDCHTSWAWFEGEGRVVEKATGKITVFLLRTRHIEFGSRRSLEDLVFGYHGVWNETRLRDQVLPGREPYLADYIAKRAVAEAEADKVNIIPHCQL